MASVVPARPMQPDPKPTFDADLPHVDDVARLSTSPVARVFHPRCASDIQRIIQLARKCKVKVSVRGTQHTMGAHTIASKGFVIDCKNLRQLSYDPNTGICTTGPGNTWADLIKHLNDYGCSPRTMQSYSTFSVGGSIAVGAHGITTDVPVSESVVWCKIVDAEGNIREAKQGDELMRSILGGYGLFGVLFEVGLKCSDNVHLNADMMATDVAHFPELYDAILADPQVDIKLARIDVTDMNTMSVFVFRRAGLDGVRTVSPLPSKPSEMGLKQQLMYKWLAPNMQEVRSIVESMSGSAWDWSDANERNILMYESAQPLAELWSPMLNVDDTFVLQEYFVPKSRFVDWCRGAKAGYMRLQTSNHVTLLNTTVRMVEQDTWSSLPYAVAPEGCVAFVLYYRMERNKEADAELASYHNEFAELSLALGGRFYLPYRHHYTQAQLLKAYPEFPAWVAAKQKADPDCLFSNEWFEHYGKPFWPSGEGIPTPFGQELPSPELIWEETEDSEPFELPIVSDRREKSMQCVLQSPVKWRAFRDEFLVNIFNLTNNVQLAANVSQAILRSRSKGGDDTEAYLRLQSILSPGGSGPGPLGLAGKLWAGLKQVHGQRKELLRQALHILGKLGRLGQLDGLVCIGDSGKLVRELQGACGVQGQAYVVNDKDPDADLAFTSVLERRSRVAVGKYVAWSYSEPSITSDQIPDQSVDLVTMNQGLHHLPQAKLMAFLADIHRILRPGGLFITREHDATEDVLPMCDAAHWIFNAVTGVSLGDEANEIRAFRPIMEWRKVLRGAGLVDVMLYEVEAGDPTVDEMMCFYKPPFVMTDPAMETSMSKSLQRAKDPSLTQGKESGLPKQIQVWMDSVPVGAFAAAQSLLAALQNWLPTVHEGIRTQTKNLPPTQRLMTEGVIGYAVPMIMRVCERIIYVLDRATVKQGNEMTDLPLDEIFLALELLATKDLATVDENATAERTLIMAASWAWGQLTGEKKEDSTPEPLRRVPSGIREPLHRRRTQEEVSALISRLVSARPDLAEPDLIDRAGAPHLIKRMVGNDREQVDRTLFEYMDTQSYEEAEAVVAKIERGVMELGAKEHATKYPFHIDVLRNKQTDSPFYDLGLAALGSPSVRFNKTGIRSATVIGLGCIIDLWTDAQARRAANSPGPEVPKSQPSNSLENYIKSLAEPEGKPSRVSVKGGPQKGVVIDDVDAIEYAMMTHIPSNTVVATCTQEVEAFCLMNHGSDSGGPQRLDLTESRVANILERLGLKTVSKAKGPPKPYRFGDLTRGLIGKAAGAVIENIVTEDPSNYELTVAYSLCTKKSRVEIAAELSERLLAEGLVSSRGLDASEYTWYKLVEWMQVELIAVFAESLDETPWFRFPFIASLRTYFAVLIEEAKIVHNKMGMQKAFATVAFWTDLIPGIVMSIIMGQMSLLAQPLQMALPDNYTAERLTEELVIVTNGEMDKISEQEWKGMDNRIYEVRKISPSLVVIKAPTFKPLTEVLTIIATSVKTCKNVSLVTIGNNVEIQVRVALTMPKPDPKAPAAEGLPQSIRTQLQDIDLQAGCAVKFHYAFPSEKEKVLLAAVEVQVPYLLDFIRYCSSRKGLDLMQIYDFYA